MNENDLNLVINPGVIHYKYRLYFDWFVIVVCMYLSVECGS